MDQQGDSNPYWLETTLLEKDAKNGWKSLGKKKALKYNNLRAIFVTFCGEGRITSAPWTAASGDPGGGLQPKINTTALRAAFFVRSRSHEQVRIALAAKK